MPAPPRRLSSALDLAREEVVRLQKERLVGGRAVAFDGPTDWTIMAWNDFRAQEFPYDEARKLAREIADNAAPVSVAMTRAMLWRLSSTAHPMEAHKIDSRAIFTRARSGDAKEGIASFLEKRTPTYPDTVSENLPDFFPWWDEALYS